MQTATQHHLELDVKKERSRQLATQLIHELHQAGYIADYCRDGSIRHLWELFYKHDVELTTADQRKLAELSK